MIDVDVKVIGEEDLAEWFQDLSGEISTDVLVSAVLAGALPVQNAAKEKAPKRTRTLARSIHEEVVERRPDYAEVAIGTDLEYAAIQEFGGTITPKNARFLAIPLTEAARQYVSPRNFPGELSAVFGGSGSGVMTDDAGTAHYALVKSVTIPAHPYLRTAIDENEDEAVAEMGAVLKSRLDQIA